jgi:hypothetical protein
MMIEILLVDYKIINIILENDSSNLAAHELAG